MSQVLRPVFLCNAMAVGKMKKKKIIKGKYSVLRQCGSFQLIRINIIYQEMREMYKTLFGVININRMFKDVFTCYSLSKKKN